MVQRVGPASQFGPVVYTFGKIAMAGSTLSRKDFLAHNRIARAFGQTCSIRADVTVPSSYFSWQRGSAQTKFVSHRWASGQRNRAETEYTQWIGEPCMENCKTEVKVTMRAMVLDVTPEEESAVVPVAEETSEEAVAEEAPAVVVAAFDADLAAKGEKVFKKCKSCHQIGEGAKNRSGPILTGVVGNAAGAVEGFKYSKPLMKMAGDGLLWTEEELAAFLAKPKAYMKGTKMSFAGLKKEGDQVAIVEYLKSFEY